MTNEEYVKKYYKTKTNGELALALNISKSSIVRLLIKLNLTRRKSSNDVKLRDPKTIKGFSNYMVDKNGIFICKDSKGFKNIIISQTYTPDGYLSIKMVNDEGKRVTNRSHRIIAKTFIKNPKNLPQINHINGIKDDNRIENLEWVDDSENLRKAYENNLRPLKLKRYTENQIKLICQELENGTPNYKIRKKFSWIRDNAIITKIKGRKAHLSISKNYNW